MQRVIRSRTMDDHYFESLLAGLDESQLRQLREKIDERLRKCNVFTSERGQCQMSRQQSM